MKPNVFQPQTGNFRRGECYKETSPYGIYIIIHELSDKIKPVTHVKLCKMFL
jgi:hypothetical protein